MKESEKKSGSAAAGNDAAPRADRVEIETPASGGAAAEEQIRMRAYELYRERGGKVGDDMADWLRAEREYLDYASRAAQPAERHASAPATSATHG
jgi:hypothetical protein